MQIQFSLSKMHCNTSALMNPSTKEGQEDQNSENTANN